MQFGLYDRTRICDAIVTLELALKMPVDKDYYESDIKSYRRHIISALSSLNNVTIGGLPIGQFID